MEERRSLVQRLSGLLPMVRFGLWLMLLLAVGFTPLALLSPSAAAATEAASPDLRVSVGHPMDFVPGSYGQFVIDVGNVGSGPTDGPVTVDMSLSPGLSAQIISALNWKPTFNPLRCTRSDALKPGASYEPIFLWVEMASPPPPTAAVTVTISGGGDVSPANNTATDAVALGRPTVTTLTSDVNPATFGQPVILTATVRPANGSGTPTGTVAFRDGAADLGMAVLAGGRASLTRSTLAIGGHNLTAIYAGDAAFKGSDSPPLALEVGPAVGVLTAVEVSGKPGSTACLEATLTPTVAGRVIDFAVGAVGVGRSTTDASGRAALSWVVPLGTPAGPSAYTATFTGDLSITGTTGTAMLTIADVPPVLAPVADQRNLEGQAVTLAVIGSDDNGDPLSYGATGLPPGLSINTDSGVISGTISGTAAGGSPYGVKVTVTDLTANGLGDGPLSDSASLTFSWTVDHDDVPPTWPAAASLAPSAVTEDGLVLTWPAAADNVAVIDYRLYQDGFLAAETAATAHQITGLTKNTAHSFKVEAGDPAGNWSADGPTVSATTALGVPILRAAPESGWLRAGDVITVGFPGQPGVAASYVLTYQQSPDGSAFGPGTPIAGSFVEDGGQVYSAVIPIPPDAGYWRDLNLAVRATDPTGATWDTALGLGCLVDTVPPTIVSAEARVTPAAGAEALAISLVSETGLTAEAVLTTPAVLTAPTSTGDAIRSQAAMALTVPMAEDPSLPGHYSGAYTGATGYQNLQVTVRAVDAAGNEAQAPVAVPAPSDHPAPAVASFTLVAPPRRVGGVAYYRSGETLSFEVVIGPGPNGGRAGSGRDGPGRTGPGRDGPGRTGPGRAGPGRTDPERVVLTIPGASLAGLVDGALLLTELRPGSGVYRGSCKVAEGDTTTSPLNPGGVVRAEATVMDFAGRQTTAVSTFRLAVDTVPPAATGLTGGPQLTVGAAAILRFTLTEPSLVLIERQREGGAWEKTQAHKPAYLPAGRRVAAVALPMPGAYHFRLTLTDRASNTRTVEFPVTVTRLSPPPHKPPATGP
ncbi:MAG TPA: Ig-like domain repeat protein [Bacillota bacterium]|jgi:hypothetical protein